MGLPNEGNDFNFAGRLAVQEAEFDAQLLEEARLNAAMAENLAEMQV